MTDVPSRHRAVSHRGPSRLERSRDRVCDAMLDLPGRVPSRRTMTAAAVGGVLIAGGAVGVQAMTAGSSDGGETSAADVPVASRLTVDQDVSRSSERAPLSAVEEAADIAQESAIQAEKDADQAEADAAEQKKKDEAAAAQERKLEEARSNPQAVAQSLLGEFGFASSEFSCLDALWSGESDWNYTATNPSSGAYGIPQSLPATKMATAGSDWETNPITQIRWGLGYIKDAYGTPCAAQGFKSGNGFY